MTCVISAEYIKNDYKLEKFKVIYKSENGSVSFNPQISRQSKRLLKFNEKINVFSFR